MRHSSPGEPIRCHHVDGLSARLDRTRGSPEGGERDESDDKVAAGSGRSTSEHRGKAGQAARVSSRSALSGSPCWLRRWELDRTGPEQPDQGGNQNSGRNVVLADSAAVNVTASDHRLRIGNVSSDVCVERDPTVNEGVAHVGFVVAGPRLPAR